MSTVFVHKCARCGASVMRQASSYGAPIDLEMLPSEWTPGGSSYFDKRVLIFCGPCGKNADKLLRDWAEQGSAV